MTLQQYRGQVRNFDGWIGPQRLFYEFYKSYTIIYFAPWGRLAGLHVFFLVAQC